MGAQKSYTKHSTSSFIHNTLKLEMVGMSTSRRIDLAGVVQWTECAPVNQMITGSIPSQGTCLGCGPGPQ